MNLDLEASIMNTDFMQVVEIGIRQSYKQLKMSEKIAV